MKFQIDLNQSIEVTLPKIVVAGVEFFEKNDHSVDFFIVPISLKSALTTHVSSLVTCFQSCILKQKRMRLIAQIFCSV